MKTEFKVGDKCVVYGKMSRITDAGKSIGCDMDRTICELTYYDEIIRIANVLVDGCQHSVSTKQLRRLKPKQYVMITREKLAKVWDDVLVDGFKGLLLGGSSSSPMFKNFCKAIGLNEDSQ